MAGYSRDMLDKMRYLPDSPQNHPELHVSILFAHTSKFSIAENIFDIGVSIVMTSIITRAIDSICIRNDDAPAHHRLTTINDIIIPIAHTVGLSY